jgi:hypothetical protein
MRIQPIRPRWPDDRSPRNGSTDDREAMSQSGTSIPRFPRGLCLDAVFISQNGTHRRFTMRMNRSAIAIQGLFCMVSSLAFLLIGCGEGTTTSANSFKTEEEGRFKGLKSLGDVSTKKAILEAKKKAALEAKEKAVPK